MGLWDRLFGRELRAEVITADDHIMRILKGIEISPETALEIPTVSACVEFISSCIAGLPVKLYRENRTENTTEEIKDDVRLRLLNDETGELLDPFQMKQAVVNDYFLYGGGFIYPEMNGNEFVSLRYIKHGAITSFLSGDDPIFKVGEYVLSNGMQLRDDEVVRLLRDTKDGLTGESVVIQHQQLLSAMYREIVYEKLLVSSGGNKKGFLTSESKLSPEMLADLRQKWQEMYANTGNNMMILNKEDLPPLGLNWIKLGLQDVLYDPKTKTIYTPNMNQSMTMTENQVNFGARKSIFKKEKV